MGSSSTSRFGRSPHRAAEEARPSFGVAPRQLSSLRDSDPRAGDHLDLSLGSEQLEGREWDGETQESHAARVLESVRRITREHPQGRVLVVTHGGSLRRLFEAIGESEGRTAAAHVAWDPAGCSGGHRHAVARSAARHPA